MKVLFVNGPPLLNADYSIGHRCEVQDSFQQISHSRKSYHGCCPFQFYSSIQDDFILNMYVCYFYVCDRVIACDFAYSLVPYILVIRPKLLWLVKIIVSRWFWERQISSRLKKTTPNSFISCMTVQIPSPYFLVANSQK